MTSRAWALLGVVLAIGCASTKKDDGDGDSDSDVDTDVDTDADTDTGSQSDTDTGSETDSGSETESESDTGTGGPCDGEDPHGLCADPIDFAAEGASDALGEYLDGSTVGRCDHQVGSCSAATDGEIAVAYVPAIDGDLRVWTDEDVTDFRVILYARPDCDSAAGEYDCSLDTPEGTSIEALDLTAGETVYVLVDGTFGQEGNFRIRFAVRPVVGDGEACDPDGLATRCDDGMRCDDLDGDGSGECVVYFCGDGVVDEAGAEECDDSTGDVEDNDGCEACVVTDICGDSSIGDTEDCDDGGVVPGDGCDADCQLELDVEPNDSCDEAEGPYADDFLRRGNFDSDFDQDWYEITIDAVALLEVWTNDLTGDGCGWDAGDGSDTTIAIYADDCVTELAYNDDDEGGGTFCSRIQMDIAAGTYFVVMAPFSVGVVDSTYEVQATW